MFKIRIVDIPKFQTAGSVFNTCDPGFCPDETGRCVPCDELGGYDFSQEQRKGQPIVPYKNERGEYVGGTGAVEHNWHRSKMETPCPQGMKKDANGNGRNARYQVSIFGTPPYDEAPRTFFAIR